jgi:endonuclease/exonuclease/phosphatase family metal-dependent hydrolase
MTALPSGDAGRPEPGPHREDVLRIMSYNVQDFTADRAAAARVVRAVGPDVLCLQEVPRRLTTELRLPAFARECGLYWAGGRIGTGGTAALTALRVRVHASSGHRLGVRFPDRTRGFAAVDVSLPGWLPIRVLSIHLGLRPDERRQHAEVIGSRLADRSVVAGDLNEGSDGGAFGRFAGRLAPASGARPTYPSDHPRAVLDVIFASRDLTSHPASEAELFRLDPEDLVAASDHRPVWVDIGRPAP